MVNRTPLWLHRKWEHGAALPRPATGLLWTSRWIAREVVASASPRGLFVQDSRGHVLGTVRRADFCDNLCAWWRYCCGGEVVDWVGEVPKGYEKYHFR